MTDEQHINGIFNAASDEAARGVFEEALYQKFGDRATAKLVVEKMALLQIPLPNEPEQFLMGQEGLLVFSNLHGVIIRIEKQDGKGYENSERAHHSGWMVQPLASIEAGKAVIEIVPGIHADNRDAESRKLFWKMWSDGYYLWDERRDNIGRLPAVPELPGADTVVSIDRMSVQRLSGSTGALQRALELLKGENNRFSYRSPRTDPSPVLDDLRQEWNTMLDAVMSKTPDLESANKYQREGYQTFLRLYPHIWPPEKTAPDFAMPEETRIAFLRTMELATQAAAKERGLQKEMDQAALHQHLLYEPMKHSFAVAWPAGTDVPDADKIGQFWQTVLDARKKGYLVDGWNEGVSDDRHVKGDKVPKAAAEYAAIARYIGKKTATFPKLSPRYERIRDH